MMLPTIQVYPHEMRLDPWKSPWLKIEDEQFTIKTEMTILSILRREKPKMKIVTLKLGPQE